MLYISTPATSVENEHSFSESTGILHELHDVRCIHLTHQTQNAIHGSFSRNQKPQRRDKNVAFQTALIRTTTAHNSHLNHEGRRNTGRLGCRSVWDSLWHSIVNSMSEVSLLSPYKVSQQSAATSTFI